MAVILMKGIVQHSARLKLEVYEWNRRVDDSKTFNAEEHQGQRGSVGQHRPLQHTLEPIQLLFHHCQQQRNQYQLDVPISEQQVPACAAEHLAENLQTLRKIGGAEENPTDHDQGESDQRLQRIEPITIFTHRPLATKDTLQAEQRAMVASPDYEVPTRAVPQPAEQHGEHQIAVGHPASPSIAPQ